MEDWSYYFNYNPETGKLYWKVSLSSKAPIGSEVGGIDQTTGYVQLRVNNKRHYARRVVWEMHNGPIPKGMQVDHINHIRYDNRLCNLRLVSCVDNARNKGKSPKNTSGYTGVYYRKDCGKWRACISVNNKTVNLGTFETKEEALAARKLAEKRLGFHPNHGKSVEGVENEYTL